MAVAFSALPNKHLSAVEQKAINQMTTSLRRLILFAELDHFTESRILLAEACLDSLLLAMKVRSFVFFRNSSCAERPLVGILYASQEELRLSQSS